ncbi:OTU domain-containing protein 4 isoform X2 [Rhinatrema bivittatum]|uniref:OTU domain-containing protein 4 isoform X2 n=1 Tax=Rhinatrema bivittatum TaxID=194408 RepID=UPI001126D5B8|nr:OTU domain-containing protein 4 isoform X2 [Rhinatrema bivittatum]
MEAAAAGDSSAGGKSEALMDGYLRSQGFYRKRVAKDGSCLFRAVAEQVLDSQSRHVEIRKACINYLQEHRDRYEAFIEGSFEDYLKRLENPQEWVGQVEISALSLMYKRDFVIYNEPNTSPSYVTENDFPDKVLLCFSNGNHYDIVYPMAYEENAATCQSILYEMLYEKVFRVDVGKLLSEQNTSHVVAEDNDGSLGLSDESDSDTEVDGCRSKTAVPADMNGFKSHSGNKQRKTEGSPAALSWLPRKVLQSLNSSVYRNVDYEVWLKSQRDQQKRDFSIAAGMQYSVGDKCKVRLEHTGRFYNAHIQEVNSENGPVVVFIEELGKKQVVSLKNLKPLVQGTNMEGWNTVSGKKVKKSLPASGQNLQPEADHRGQKNPTKPGKSQSVLPPRLQHAVGSQQQHHFSTQSSGPASQHTPLEHKTQSRTPPQVTARSDRERSEDSEDTSREGGYFGLSPEERREKQAIEESRSLYEMQHMDEEAFPALSSQTVCQAATQTNESNQRKPVEKKSTRQRANIEERKNKDLSSKLVQSDQSTESSTEKSERDEKCARSASPVKEEKTRSPPVPAEQRSEHLPTTVPSVNLTPASLVLTEMQTHPAVPSTPPTVPAWPNEPTACRLTGIPTQIPVSPVTLAPAEGLDSAMPQPQVTATPFAPVPVSIQAVNQPLMPLPQTLNPYQDPLYPGFPFNEKGDRATAPPYSLCKSGEDLPKDKSILQFFFNLGVKAYSCPMWAPHSYLYPLHQAYLNACRMYPKVPLYSPNPWFQETISTVPDNDPAQANPHPPVQNEARVNGQCPQVDYTASPPLLIPTAQVAGSAGQVPQQDIVNEHAVQLHAGYEEPFGSKSIYPQPAFGHSSYLGAVPIAPSFFPPLWYGYPFQGFIESPAMQHNVLMQTESKGATAHIVSEEVDVAKKCNAADLSASLKEQNSDVSNVGGLHFPTACVSSEPIQDAVLDRVPKMEQGGAIPSPPQGKIEVSSSPARKQEMETQVAMLPPPLSDREPPKSHLPNAIPRPKEKVENTKDPKASGSLQAVPSESGAPQRREESSEDECEVSDMLRSGRSKNFYNQTYGGRKYRGDRGYLSNRGGYHYPRNDEVWRGQGNRNRDDGYYYHRNVRGRPYRSDNRRRPAGDLYRAQQE